ncbi:pyridoxal phosphate-dependent decarboxylase family protein [Actinomadura parmotrematis]|uniref:Aminotransferase class V-fold PLP-dependent enzyme n=1 Tax=Actinomadura parmotrematis TaxID=2864039 RepID=A0ABS7FLZ7_9ACTN|nr:pyridoxal-dependent decarboxylase [Actinomadura parmotrematis]MBW8481384.1 hypothetical protein [Actinomadura parmotrematis]
MTQIDDRCAAPAAPSAPPGEGVGEAFDARRFRESAGAVAARLAGPLTDLSVRGLALTDPAELTAAARALMTAERDRIAPHDPARLDAIMDLYVRTGIPVHSPGAMGRQFSGVVPLAGVMDFAGAMVSQPASFYEAGQLPSVAERIMGEELGRLIGWDPAAAAMVTTSGGSLANLTALLAARARAFPALWTRGGTDGVRPAVAVGADAHYSVTRAAGVMGIGETQIVRLPLDAARRIDVRRAGPALAAARRRGLSVFCLVASAGTTSVGAFDPLDELAGLCREHGLWLHVDGAHGASLLVSGELRGRLRGVEHADSLTWDAHKLMFVPAPCTMLFYRDGARSLGAFRQRASYVFDEEPDEYAALDSGGRNFECTKRPMIMPLWTLWAMHGPALFAQKIEHVCRLARDAHGLLLAEPDFEAVHAPQANILCFRHRPRGLAAPDVHRFQNAVRNRVRGGGSFFISKVDIDGTAALRAVLMSHHTTLDHVRMLLAEIRDAGRALLAEGADR